MGEGYVNFAVWFRWAIFLGIAQDWLFGLPGIFVPNGVLGLAHVQRADDPVWAAYASMALVLLGLVYIPGAIDPFKYKPHAILAVAARGAGVVFFFFLYPGFFPTWFGLVDLTFTVVQGALLVLTLRGASTGSSAPPEKDARGRVWTKVAAVVGVVVALAGAGVWYELFREIPQQFSSPEEAFKYGSIGTEAEQGLPYLIWLVLPEMFPKYLPGPGGYASLGLVWEPGHEMPVGFSKKTIGFERVGITCAVCHSGTYRTDPSAPPVVVPTAPATRLDVQRYQQFLSAAASDPAFTPDGVMRAIGRHAQLNPVDAALYRYVLIPRVRDALLQQKAESAWEDSRPAWGRGRIDPFNPVKFGHILGLDPSQDQTIGNSDMEPLWDMGKQQGYSLHWDGLDASLTEVVLTGALGDGATPASLPVQDLHAVQDWISGVRPPTYPFPVDRPLAGQGSAIYGQLCASCHAFGGARTGTVIPQGEIGTDRHRLDMWTQEAATRYNAYASNYPWHFSHFVKTDGYVSVPLDGAWLRAPYLHNGSVPTMDDLLKPVAQRPTVFYRGYDVYDPARMGFVSDGDAARAFGTKYDTGVAGNGNAGHEGHAYGTDLSDEQRRALLEFLKTL